MASNTHTQMLVPNYIYSCKNDQHIKISNRLHNFCVFMFALNAVSLKSTLQAFTV